MIAATPAAQRRLLDLQEVDTAIRQLQNRRTNLPEQVALDENADTLSRISGEYATSRDQLERLGVQQRRHEAEIATVDSRRKSEEGRMYSGLITSAKELEALRNEISALRVRKRDLEDTLLEVMEQTEELESVVATLAERHEELTGRVTALETARDEAARDIDAELGAKQEQRLALADDLPPDVIAFYDELRARKQGVAVALLQGRSCMGCRLELTQIELEDTRRDAQHGLARCEQCGRILILST